SLSGVSTSRRSTSPARTPRGLGDARKLSQRIPAPNRAGSVHTTAPERVTRRSVVIVWRPDLIGNGVLVKSSTSVPRRANRKLHVPSRSRAEPEADPGGSAGAASGRLVARRHPMAVQAREQERQGDGDGGGAPDQGPHQRTRVEA